MSANLPLLFIVVFVWLTESIETTEISTSSSVVVSNGTLAVALVVFGIPAARRRPSVHNVQYGVGHGAVQALPERLERGRKADLLVPTACLAGGRDHHLGHDRQINEQIADK